MKLQDKGKFSGFKCVKEWWKGCLYYSINIIIKDSIYEGVKRGKHYDDANEYINRSEQIRVTVGRSESGRSGEER